MEFLKLLKDDNDREHYIRTANKAGYILVDKNKSFDVINIIKIVEELNLDKGANILNLGAFGDSSLWALHHDGYENLYGVDLNKKIYNTMYYTKIRYQFGNIEKTHFPPIFFDFAMSLSVIEHDVDLEKFFTEANRLLKSGSTLVITTDYLQNKVDVKRKGWKLFSLEEIIKMVNIAEKCGFEPLFDKSLFKDEKTLSTTNPILNEGFNYTFILLGFIKKGKDPEFKIPKEITLINYAKNFGSVTPYCELIQERLKNDYNVEAHITDDTANCKTENVIIEFNPGIVSAEKLLADIKELKRRNRKIYIDVHNVLYTTFSKEQIIYLEKNTKLMYRANELPEIDHVGDYLLCPTISHFTEKVPKIEHKNDEIILGTFGFASSWKRYPEIIRLANKLGVKTKLMLSVPTESSKKAERDARNLINKLKEQNKNNKNIIIKEGMFTDNTKKGHFNQKRELINELNECTHFIFANRNNPAPSGSMHFVKMFERPIISLDTYEAKQMQVIRSKFFASKWTVFSDFLYIFAMRTASHFVKGSGIDWVEQARELLGMIDWRGKNLKDQRENTITYEFLRNCKEISRDEDGLKYMIQILGSGGRAD